MNPTDTQTNDGGPAWRDMASAPTDGTLVKICWESADGPMFDLAKWNGELWVATRMNPWSGLPYICRNPLGWLPAPPKEVQA